MGKRPACVGSGLVTLDVICGEGGGRPGFFAGGSCGNVLTILSYLGWDSYPIARLGDDPEGDRIVEDMGRWGARTDFVGRERGSPSPRIIERIAPRGRAGHTFHFECEHGKRLPRRMPCTIKSAGAALSDIPDAGVFYFDRADRGALALARGMKEKGAVVFFEPPRFKDGGDFAECLRIADVVKRCGGPGGIEPGTGAPLEIQTMGEGGLAYRTNSAGNGSWRRMDAFPVRRTVDAAGSGDWLSAGLIHRLFGGGSRAIPAPDKIEEALRWGSALASINCNFAGARGAMYRLSKKEIFRLAGLVVRSRNAAEIKGAPGELQPHGRSRECRICLCGA